MAISQRRIMKNGKQKYFYGKRKFFPLNGTLKAENYAIKI